MVSWSIFNELDSLRREMDEAFRGLGLARTGTFAAQLPARRYPLLNLSEDQDNLYVDAVLPGIDPHELQLSLLSGALTISGERKACEGKGVLHRCELGFGKFSRCIDLPVCIDPDNTTAEYRDGIMRIRMAKSENAKPKRIEVVQG